MFLDLLLYLTFKYFDISLYDLVFNLNIKQSENLNNFVSKNLNFFLLILYKHRLINNEITFKNKIIF